MQGIGNLFTYNALVNFWGSHLVYIGIFLILTLSLNLINGYTGLFSLGHHGFWMIGAYVGGYFVVTLRPSGDVPIHVDALLLGGALVVGWMGAALAGLVVGVPCLRLRGDYLAIATLGFAEIVRVVIMNINAVGGSTGYRVPYLFGLVGGQKILFFLIASWLWVGIVLICIRNLVNSYHGRAMRSISQDEVAAQLVGVNIAYYKVLSFVIGAGFAGIAGVLFGFFVGFFTPEDFGFMRGVTILLMVVLGGLGNLKGTIVATVVLYLIPELLKLNLVDPTAQGAGLATRVVGTVMQFVSKWYMVFYAILLIALMVTRPQGILQGKRKAEGVE